ncbi:MAG TPA: hypothetical protein VGB92_24140 [Longimicrobium sp.]|jgi:hypothetical protein
MKASDIYIGSRQFFGYIIPGSLWLTAWMLFQDTTPSIQLSGSSWLLKFILFIGLCFVIGYSVQTVLFLVIMKMRVGITSAAAGETCATKEDRGKPDPTIDELYSNLLCAVKETLKEQPAACLYDTQLPLYCKNYVRENSLHLRDQIAETEGEINLTAGLALPLLVLPFAWMKFEDQSWSGVHWSVLAVSIVLGLVLLFFRLRETRAGEELMWLEMYLLLKSEEPHALREQSR